MKVLNFGSLNYDYVYSVDHIVSPGETTPTYKMETFCGGKGLNQSVALARAGLQVYHAGAVGSDGDLLLQVCRENFIDTEYVKTLDGKSGHTVIQVDKNGQNCILLYGGTNRAIPKQHIDYVLQQFQMGDMCVLQNEVNDIPYIIEKAAKKGMTVVLNPSPLDTVIDQCNLHLVSVFLVNEIEGAGITGKTEPMEILDEFEKKYPTATVVLTLGKDGAYCMRDGKRAFQDIIPSQVVDTTAAGDTFTGYFLSQMLNGSTIEQALYTATKASSIAVSKNGAVSSIPYIKDVLG